MSVESKPALEFEIGHVLFIDIVGYSKLLIDDQHESLEKLNQIVRNTSSFASANAAGNLSRLSTGDGMVLVFASNPAAPVQCALEISRSLQSHAELHVRMGIHSGPVSAIRDLNDRANVAGGGINLAQRVMDCGDAGHILVSKRMAEDLEQYRQWQPHLHHLGEVEVKHGVRVAIVNLYTDELGNPEVPAKFKTTAQQSAEREVVPASGPKRKIGLLAGAVGLLAVLAIGAWIFTHRIAPKSEHVPSESSSIPAKSIAVLPLENLSEEKENAFFADGIQEDILTGLAKIADLKVISRTSVMQYRGAGGNRNLRDIAQALGVEKILEGSVRRVGNHVLVNVQLIDARQDRQIWAERYDRAVADSLGLQGELATQIATALKAKLAPEEKARLDAKPTANPEAYVLYLTALGSGNDIEAEQLYMQATALDPGFALAYARASIKNSGISTAMTSDHQARKAKARFQAEEALRLLPNLGEAHMALALCLYLGDKKYNAALKEFEVAAASSPNNAEIHGYVAGIYRRQGRWRESVASFERAMSLDPRNRGVVFNAGNNYLFMRDWPAATACYNRALEIAADFVRPKVGLAYLEVFRNGNPTAGRRILQNIPEIAPPMDR
jgi:TolB-like protein